jgi:hypothetical protein
MAETRKPISLATESDQKSFNDLLVVLLGDETSFCCRLIEQQKWDESERERPSPT